MKHWPNPRPTRRPDCGVPSGNHEVRAANRVFGVFGGWECRACEFQGTREQATGHVVEHQFTVRPGGQPY